MKSGMYDLMGNAIEYVAGDDCGYDIDAGEEVPVEMLEALGEYIGKLS